MLCLSILGMGGKCPVDIRNVSKLFRKTKTNKML